MEELTTLLPLAAAMLCTGAVAGILAGLLGVGGGIVVVPVLDLVLGAMGTDPGIRMHVAVATSLATIVPTSISSTRAHHGRGAVDFDIARYWGPFILVGSIAGTLVASTLNSAQLALIFGVVALLVALKMILPVADRPVTQGVVRGLLGPVIPTAVGGVSSMMGIGGGTFTVPALTLMNQPIHRAVGTAALFGLFISLPGALAYVVSGWNDPRLPVGSLGYVNLIGLLMISPVTVLMAPVGARIAHRLEQRHLTAFFGAFLLLVSLRMLYRALA